MALSKLEQTLIDNAKGHQEALAAYYPMHQRGQSNDEAHTQYLKHSGALTDLISLAQHESGLSVEAADELRKLDELNATTFMEYFLVERPWVSQQQ